MRIEAYIFGRKRRESSPRRHQFIVFLKLLKFLFAYIAFSVSCNTLFAQQKNVVLIDNWTDTSIVAGQENARFNDVWGFEVNGENYCVMGSTIGHHFFKIEENEISFLDFKPGKFQSKTVVHRDYKTYGNYLYAVCDEGNSSLQVYDISTLPNSVSLVYEDSLSFKTAHNIFIDTLKAKLYVCAPDDFGMKILDLSIPEMPSLILNFTTISYVHDCYVRNDTAYLNSGFNGLQIYYFGGGIPIQIGLLDFYPDQGYNHSGWLSPSGEKYVFIDETQGTRVKYCKVNDLSQINIDETFVTENFLNAVPHNVFLLDNLAFVSYYNEGLRIFDTGNFPIVELGYYDTFSEDTDYKLNGAWGVFVFPENDQILVSDRQNGLFLFSFPIQVMDAGLNGTFIAQNPFINNNSILITEEYFIEDNLTFSISSVNGQRVYFQESYLNWLNIPIDISAGIYVYSIYNQNKDLLASGKFVKAN